MCALGGAVAFAQSDEKDRIPSLPDLPAPLEVQIADVAPRLEHGQVAVLGYGELGDQGLSADDFRQQMLYLKESGLPILSLADFLAWKAGKHPLDGLAVLITLDAATERTWKIAYPVLKELGFPYLVFIDGFNLQNKPGYATVQQLRQAAAEGAAIGSHTMTRPAPAQWQFASLAGEVNSRALADAEFGESARRIQACFGSCVALSYPTGCAESVTPGTVSHYGYLVAFGLRGGKVSRLSSSYSINRYGIRDHASFARAVNSGKESDVESLRQRVDSIPVAAAIPTPEQPSVLEESGKVSKTAVSADIVFEDDDYAEEVEISASSMSPGTASQQEQSSSLLLDESGEWVTRCFAQPLVPREQTKVIVLGYHNFSNEKPLSEMLMRTSEFCQQMQYLRDSGISIITMQDFLDWRQGRRNLPAHCALITIDDGWKSVWTDAYPVLKAYGYPFTLFLYTRYIDVKGDSMKLDWIREMQKHGATIGSHSTSHLYPRFWKRYQQESPEYRQQIQQEIIQSAVRLKELFGHCSTYCYPGGYNTPAMVEGVRQAFQAAFTVLESKVDAEENPYLVHRYMVFGNDSSIFRRAVNFGHATAAQMREAIAFSLPRARAFFPQAFKGNMADQMSYTATADKKRKARFPKVPVHAEPSLEPQSVEAPSSSAL